MGLNFLMMCKLIIVLDKGKPLCKPSYELSKEEDVCDPLLDISPYPKLIRFKDFIGRIHNCVTAFRK